MLFFSIRKEEKIKNFAFPCSVWIPHSIHYEPGDLPGLSHLMEELGGK